jgi:hypothetical protein
MNQSMNGVRFESLGIEEPESCKIYRNGAWRQLSLLEQFRLVFANLLGAQAVWRALEALREIFHYPDVTVYGSFGIITTLSFRAGRPAKPHENHLELRSGPPGAARSRTQWRSRGRDAV